MPSYDYGHKVIVKLRCMACGHKYRRTLRSENEPDPPCPVCDVAATKPRGFKFNGRAPARGGSILSKAVDRTAEIVMQDYGHTNMLDAKRPGDTSAPKLPAPQQARADAFFQQGRSFAEQNPAMAKTFSAAATMASSGALARNDDARIIDRVLSKPPKPNIRIVAG